MPESNGIQRREPPILRGLRAAGNWIGRLLDAQLPIAASHGLRR
jgi:hypothetical protein